LAAGADTYLTKPLDVVDFFQVLDKTSPANQGKNSALAARSSGQLSEVGS
jgi:hypothetical protein